MKISQDLNEGFNIVAMGSWNPAIFSPQWVKSHLADDQNKDVVMAFSMPVTSFPPRITVDGVNIYPSAQLLALDCVNYTDETAGACAVKMQKIFDLLPHTPVTALGINYRFTGTLDESVSLTSLFTFSDAGKIDAGKYVASGALVKRSFRLGDRDFLNLTFDTLSDSLRVEFNFHSDVIDAFEARAKSTSERVMQKKTEAEEFLSTVYGIVVEN